MLEFDWQAAYESWQRLTMVSLHTQDGIDGTGKVPPQVFNIN